MKTVVQLPVAFGSNNINNISSNNFAGTFSQLGCNACHKNQSPTLKHTKKRRKFSTSGSTSFLSLTETFANNIEPGKHSQKMQSLKPAGIKQESLKHAHSEVQNEFAKNLAKALENEHGIMLQCCITYSKPCGCIRKYILGGENWKENSKLQLRNADDIDPVAVSAQDQSMLGNIQLNRATELVAVYEHAAELKKEKCYAFNNVEVEGKSLKELRGMIGLGNGRKRSKKYEDYVLQMRTRLRNQYALCEKAAQKLLGYSINFLYKKLRTNPQKTSRLVATNKAERASKAPRHLIPLEELREMGRKANGNNQCCGRNCISRLAAQNFEKIEDWRKRLEGSGQRVAQEIVAEVLRASSTSLDGQSSFCQNLVHWVTGCSFKKIRRVRDHLKKDPQSLPEHGLKKYWKDKVKNKQKSEPLTKITPKTEIPDFQDVDMMHTDGNIYGAYYGHNVQMQQQNFGLPNHYNTDAMYSAVVNGNSQRLSHYAQQGPSEAREQTASAQWPGTNLNNSNNMMAARGYGMSNTDKPIFGVVQAVMPGAAYSHNLHTDKNRNTPDVTQMSTNSCQYQNVSQNRAAQTHTQSTMYSTRADEDNVQFQNRSRKLPPRTMTASPYQPANPTGIQTNQQFNQQQPSYANNAHPMKDQNADSRAMIQQHAGQSTARSSVILHTAGSQHQQAPTVSDPPPYNQGSRIEGRIDGYNGHQMDTTNQNDLVSMAFNSGQMYGQHYYIAAAPNNGYDGSFFHNGMPQGLTPFVLSQQGEEMENSDEMKNSDSYGYPRQPVYIFSPIPGDKGFTPSDLQGLKQLTPIQLLQTPYLPQGKNQGDGNGEGHGGQEPQRFLFPMPLTNQEPSAGDYEKSDATNVAKIENQDGGAMHLPSGAALTPLAVVHNANGAAQFVNLGSWAMPNQSENVDNSHHTDTRNTLGSQQWPVWALQQYPPNINLEQVQGQSHLMYDASQFHGYGSQYAIGPMHPATVNTDKANSTDTWQHTDETNKEIPEIREQPQLVSNVPGVYPQPYEQGLNKSSSEIEKTAEHDESEDKEGEEIVTPNIIREALSNKFGARVASAGVNEEPTVPKVPPLAPIPKKTANAEPKPAPPPLEMPKLGPITTRPGKQEDNRTISEDDNEERCASISTRVKRFSRDRLRATIDSPNIVLTPFTPLTPSITPVIIIPDTGDADTGKEDASTSASSTNSQHMDGNIFLFPPTHVSRRRAAIRLQGQTVSDTKRVKTKNPKDSPKTPGPFPVADGETKTDDTENKTDKDENISQMPGEEKSKTPTLTLRGISQPGEQDRSQAKDKVPFIGFDATHWHDDSTIPSPVGDASDDTALNTPTQQPLNTPTSQLNTPNQDLKTPTESPVKSLQSGPMKRKLEASPGTPENSTAFTETSFSSSSSGSKSSVSSGAPSAKSLRFHCFTPKDFNEGVNCSAFRKPSEFASVPTESAIAQRRRRPRKQLNPSAVSTPEDEKANDVTMEELPSDDDGQETEEIKASAKEVESKDTTGQKEETSTTQTKISPPKKPSFPGFPRILGGQNMPMPDGNIMVLGNPYDSQTPSFLQLVTPSLFPSATGGGQEQGPRQQTPFSSQQVNTPVFLHSAPFLTPSGSTVVRRISPSNLSSNTPQFFTFMPQGGLMTPNKPSTNTQEIKSPSKKIVDKQQDKSQKSDGINENDKSDKEPTKITKDRHKSKRSSMTLPLGEMNVPPSPALTGKESGLQTPSNLKVVTPSLTLNSASSVPTSEGSQIFNFPTSGMPGLYPGPHSSVRAPPRGYVLCTPTKSSPTGSKILYQPCTSPSTTGGPMALVPLEMLSSPPKKMRSDKDSSGSKTSTQKEPTEEAESKETNVPVIVVEPPKDEKSKDKRKASASANKSAATISSNTTSDTDVSETNAPKEQNVATDPSPPKRKPRKKSTGSPKDFPKPLALGHTNIDNPNVQTPTMIHLVSPSQHSPNSPSVVFYPMMRPPFGPGHQGSKLQSPLSAGSSTGGTPPIMVLQRFGAPVGSSSLLKSAIMKNMLVFQFPPPPTTSATTQGSDDPKSLTSTSSSTSSTASTSTSDCSKITDIDDSSATTTPSAAVSVICGPRVSTPRLSEKLSGPNDPCLSEAAQE
uniref:uncharacterized protein LOC120344326 n=1 Tax=Styela clava TaxID=7725 RepID=UPI00193A80E3|nr:uncharacterized protein LOC120344326 [Styela clava]